MWVGWTEGYIEGLGQQRGKEEKGTSGYGEERGKEWEVDGR